MRPGACADEARAASQDGGAGFDRSADLSLEPVQQVSAGHGTDRGAGIGGIADLQVSHRRGEPAGELIGDSAVHYEALGGKATLAAVDEARLDGRGDSEVEICIV